MRHTLVLAMVGIFGILGMTATASADVTIITDATWKVTSPAPLDGWNIDPTFDDSTWVTPVVNTANNNMWMTSLKSASSPSQIWARKVFTLTAPVASAVGHFGFDDNGELYLNGHLLIDDTGGGATVFNNFVIDPSFFVVGNNVLAMHGINTIAPDNSLNVDLPIILVPEPSCVCLLGAGVMGLLIRRRPAHA